MYSRVAIFDFDSTMVNSPIQTKENEQKWADYYNKEKWPFLSWWTRPQSLDMDVFDITTNPEVVRDYMEESKNPKTLKVLLTGRVIELEPQVRKILDKKGFTFDMYLFKEGGLTENSKMRHMADIIDKYPSIKEMEMWDDRKEHVDVFERWGKYIEHTDNIKFKLNKVIDGRPKH
jgi:hypothetical protein